MKSSRQAANSTRAVQSGSVRGASGQVARGAYCTPRHVADALPAFDLDPFTNARSHVRSALACMLERGDDGFGNGAPGSFLVQASQLPTSPQAHNLASEVTIATSGRVLLRATYRTRVFKQPDYTQTLPACRHYLHTRFVALLRFDPRPEWADLIGGASEWIGVLSNSPGRSSFDFDAPPDVSTSSNTFPHALYARHYADVTPAMRALCSYPDGTARHWRKRSALAGAGAHDWLTRWGLAPELFNLET